MRVKRWVDAAQKRVQRSTPPQRTEEEKRQKQDANAPLVPARIICTLQYLDAVARAKWLCMYASSATKNKSRRKGTEKRIGTEEGERTGKEGEDEDGTRDLAPAQLRRR